jgi:hypothetical protein
MKKVLFLMILVFSIAVGSCLADGFEADLTVGSDSIEGGLHFKRDLANGFWRAGGSVLYTDDDDMEYKWAEVDFAVGSETLAPGMTCDVGVKGVLGEAEDDGFSGDVGALAFAGRINYLFPQQRTPVPIEVFAGFAYAPQILSFRDTEEYMAYHVGVGVRIVQNASIILKYNSYDVDMETRSIPWDLDDSNVRLGLVMRF